MKEVNECGFFSLMVDEAKSHRVQQLCVCIRYIYDAVLKERVITMEDVSLSRTADSLANIILPFLNSIGITAIMVGQSYDGASVMSGVKNGLQKIICDNNNPFAMYVHCLAHKLNLVLVAACNDNDMSCNFFNIMQSLYEYFSYPDSHSQFKNMQKELKIKSPGPHEIHKLSDTRWSCRATAVLSVKRNYTAIVAVLSTTAADLRHSKSPQARGLLVSIKSNDFIVCLVVFAEYLPLINILSKALQRADTCIAQCAKTASGVIQELSSKRNEAAWEEKWDEVKVFGKDCGSDFGLDIIPGPSDVEEEVSGAQKPKRPRMISKKLDDYNVLTSVGQRLRKGDGDVEEESEEVENEESKLKRKYRCNFFYPVLDTLIEEMRRRFTGEALKIAKSSEDFLRLDEVDSKFFLSTAILYQVQIPQC